MNKKFTKLMAALALLTFLAVPMGMWGQTTVDVTLSSGTFNNNVITWTCADGNITIQQLKGSGSTNPNGSYMGRVYKQNILSFVGTNGYTITNIDIKCDGSYYGTTKYAGTEISNNDVSNNTTALNPTWSTTNGGTHTIATVSSDGLSEIYIQNGHSSDANSQLRITKLTITYKVTGSVTATTVTINASGLTNTDVYTSTTAGTLTASVTETVSGDAISGATVTWTSSDTEVATIDNNGAVTLVAVGTTTITASYAGGNGYGSSSATYELTVTSSEPYVQPTTIEIVPNYEFWGKTGQFSGSTYSELEGSKDNVTLSWTRGSGSTYANSTAMRFYKDNNLTFTAPEGYEITSIVITFTTTQSDLSFSPEGYSLSETTGTWTGSSATVTMSRPSNASNYAQISMFTITLATPAPKYTLTAAMTNVAEYFVFVGGNEIEFDNNNQAQVSAGATIYVSLTMQDCYALTSLTVNSSTTGVTVEEPGVYYSFVMPEGDATIGVSATQATEYTLTVAGLNNVTYTDILAGVDSEEVTLTNNQVTLCEGISVDIVGLTANAGLSLQSVTLNDGTTTTTLELEYGVYHFTMPSSNATLTFTTTTAPTYTLATSIESGKSYIIVGMANGKYYAMGKQNSNNRAAEEIIVDNNIATVSSVDVYEFTISSLADEGFYSIYDARTPGYLYAAASGSNYLKTENELDENHNGDWEITFNSDDGSANVIASNSGNRNVMRFNNSSILFSCYTSGQNPVYLYVKDETPATESYDLTINGYGSSTKEGWNLIASPVSTTPDQVTNMLTDETTAPYSYDLYRFNQAAESEWENYHQHSGDFNIVPGKGYLYANKGDVNNTPNTVTLTFTGVPYSGDGEIELVYSETNGDSNMWGWNLIGNPYSVNAEISADYYMMNPAGSELIANDGYIVEAMQGVFVQAESEGETVIFDPQSRAKSNDNDNKVVINISRNRGIIVDRAVVRFGEGRQLPKMQLFENSTKLYITQDNKDYAVVRTEAQGEMPVNFKAAENGTYTLTVNPEGVEMNYLHLIDNMTGADIDLLAATSTGSVATYTFNASTTDYSSRFRLVFAANNEDGVSTGSTAFAFYSNGTWVINNTGEATLQVVDVMGRMLSSEIVNGSVSKAINATAGVYMLRLINGNDVKTQKIVVR